MRQPFRNIVVIAMSAAVAACSFVESPQTFEQLRELTAAPSAAFVDPGRRGRAAWERTREFYARRSYRPVWIEGQRPTQALEALLAILDEVDRHGLDRTDYDTESLAADWQRANERWLVPRLERTRVAAVDAHATYAFLRLGDDLLHGRVRPREVDARWNGGVSTKDLTPTLETALREDRVAETLASLAPRHDQYWSLQRALQDYRDELQTETAGSSEAEATGRRVRQIEMNLDRWRWLPRDHADRQILVNIPAYELHVLDGSEHVQTMRVIVGAPESPTPVFSDQMTYVVFSPYWNIPESILRNETLPRVVKDIDYLARNGIEVVRTSGDPEPVDPAGVDWSIDLATQGLRLRQVPGPENAMGLVKFIFPNHFSVYLHDTPSDSLFARPGRALSHGCIRLEQPVALATYVLADRKKWSQAKITEAMSGGRETVVHLERPVAVHLGYWTTWVRADGRVAFTGDPYGVDRRHARASGKVPGPVRSGSAP